MWFNTGAARVGDGACACVRPVVSGVGPKCGRAWHMADMGRLAVQWQWCGSGRLALAVAVCAYAYMYASIDDAYAYMHLLIRGSEPLIHALIHTIGVD